MFKIKNTSFSQVIRFEMNPLVRFNRLFKVLFFLIFLLSLGGFIANIFLKIVDEQMARKVLGASLMSFSLGFFFFEINLFFKIKLKHPKLKHTLGDLMTSPREFNLASFLNFEATKVCKHSGKIAHKTKYNEISQESLLLSLLSIKTRIMRFVMGRTELPVEEIKKDLREKIERGQTTPGFEEIILKAAKISEKKKKDKIWVSDILTALAHEESFSKLLYLKNFRPKDIDNLARWFERIERREKDRSAFWSEINLLKRGSIGKDLSSGYSINLDKYTMDIREIIGNTGFRDVTGHKREISQTERILEKEDINNVLLVGEPGTGRKSIVRAVAQNAFMGKSSPHVNFKRVLEFNIGQLSAEAQTPEEFEMKLDICFREAVRAGNIIMVIYDLEKYSSYEAGTGKVDISGLLSQYLQSPKFQLIAITSYRGYHNTIEKRSSFSSLFEKVEVEEISEDESIDYLEDILPYYENKYKKFITYRSLREIMRLSARYLQDTPFPDKAVRLLDESVSWLAVFSMDKVLREKHIRKVVAEKIQLPLEELEGKEKQKLLNLEELIHERLINQEEAVREVSSALRRARAEIQTRQAPIGSFLFLGPTGVGKTEASKALAAIYFGSESKMLRFDMSEFQSIDDIKRLIGDGQTPGYLTTRVKDNPFSLVLFDELEKAHPDILNLFLQVLDEGWLTDGMGRKVDFKNTMIIATSNAGARLIMERVQEGRVDGLKEELVNHLLKNNLFRPEFINRFDATVMFTPLSKDHLVKIAHLMLNKIVKNLKDRGITFYITKELKEKIVELGYSPEFGARQMNRVIQDKVENALAKALLSDKLKRGYSVKVDPETFNLEITNG